MGATFDIAHPDVDETLLDGESPGEHVRRLSLAKARAVVAQPFIDVVVGSDTTVVLDGDVLGKPSNAGEAHTMLGRLSGRTHTVFTGYALLHVRSGREIVGHEETRVTFRKLEPEEIAHYVAGGSPLDKAGAYGIQDDFGAVFIERIDGDYYTVVGLPVCRVYTELRKLAAPPSAPTS
jgi:septum formation protein